MQKPKISVCGLFGNSVFLQVEHFHAPGETLHARTLYSEPGGKGYNQAVAAARLGGQVTFYGCGGNDAACREAARFLEEEGICHHIHLTDAAATAFACILTDRRGENRVTVCRGASELLSAQYVQQFSDLLKDSDILLLNLEYPAPVNEMLLLLAEEAKIPVILNPAPAAALPAHWPGRCFVLTPNRQEAAVLTGLPATAGAEELALGLQRLGVRRAVITLGAQGAFVLDDGQMYGKPGIPVTAVDTTGAGDCFNGALAVALGQGSTLREAVALAVRASAYSVQHPYVMPSLPTARQLSNI